MHYVPRPAAQGSLVICDMQYRCPLKHRAARYFTNSRNFKHCKILWNVCFLTTNFALGVNFKFDIFGSPLWIRRVPLSLIQHRLNDLSYSISNWLRTRFQLETLEAFKNNPVLLQLFQPRHSNECLVLYIACLSVKIIHKGINLKKKSVGNRLILLLS